MGIGENLKKYREKHNLTQEELAKKLCISRSAVAKWEQGRGTPTTEIAIQIASILDIPCSELLGIDELIETNVFNRVDELLTKRLEEEKQHKKYKRKKTCKIISRVIICSFLIFLVVSLSILAFPRKMSHYMDITEDEISQIYVIYGRNNRADIDVGYFNELNTKMNKLYLRKDYFPRSETSGYLICIVTKDGESYHINDNSIKINGSMDRYKIYGHEKDYEGPLGSVIERIVKKVVGEDYAKN